MALPHIQPLIRIVSMARERFLYGLDRTPDDRLNWSPGGDAPSPLQLAGKTARFLGAMCHYLEHHTILERPTSPPPPPASREAARAALDAAFGRLQAVLDKITDADLPQPLPMPWGASVPLGELLWTVTGTINYHSLVCPLLGAALRWISAGGRPASARLLLLPNRGRGA
jgi:hypothetical protein